MSIADTFTPQATRPLVDCRLVVDGGELEAHFAVRREVFVTEQGLFSDSDRDERDDAPSTLHVVASLGAQVCGTVRLYPVDPNGFAWQGDRLAVLPEFRRARVGSPLVRYAMSAATQLGGELMVAKIQLPNVPFFRRLGWSVDGAIQPYAGVDHQPMIIRLGFCYDAPSVEAAVSRDAAGTS